MPSYQQLANLNGNVMAAVDIETTGRIPGWHEIIQIAIVPLTSELRPIEGVSPFYRLIKPAYPERAEKRALEVSGLSIELIMDTALDSFAIAERLDEWFNRLELPFERRLEPLAHNWAYEKGFLTDWLGVEDVDHYFHFHPRDTMQTAIFLNDYACFSGGLPPFRAVGLSDLCRQLGIVNEKAHDALADSVACAEVYRRLLSFASGATL